MKQKTLFKETMKNDLMRVYREISSQCECRTQDEAYRLTVTHEAPRFYVDARWAYQMIEPMTRGERSRLEKMTPLTRMMYEDLFDVVMRLMQMEKFWGKRLSYVLQYAVLEKAPRFYIKPDTVRGIWKEKTRSMMKSNERKLC